MAETTQEVILNVQVGGATSIKDLKKEIDALSTAIANADEGTEEYDKAVAALTKTQEQLRKATALSKDGTVALAGSYDYMQKRLTQLRREWKQMKVDYSEGSEWMKKAKDINTLNDALKKADAQIGNFQRNVGNYRGAISDSMGELVGSLSKIPGLAQAAKFGMDMMNGSMKALASSNPFGLIVTALTTVIGFIPQITDFVRTLTGTAKAMERLANSTKFASEQAKQNAEVIAYNQKMLAAQGKTADEVAKYTVDAAQRSMDSLIAYRDGLTQKLAKAGKKDKDSIKEQIDAIQADIDTFAKLQNDTINDNVIRRQEAITKAAEDERAANEKSVEESAKAAQAKREAAAAEYAKFLSTQEAMDAAALAEEQAWMNDSVNTYIKGEEEKRKASKANADRIYKDFKAAQDDMTKAKEAADRKQMESEKAKKAVYMTSADAVASVLGSVADIIESTAGESEEAAKAVKGIRIAEATIETIKGAVSSFMMAQATYPPPMGTIIGSVQAGVVAAMGAANIAKIAATDTSGNATASSVSVDTGQASGVSAPTIQESVAPVYRNLTSASEEDRLNAAAADSRVYILSSDLEANGRRVAIREEETSF